jgi:hypothetical protein
VGQSESDVATGETSPVIRAAAVGYLVLGLGFGLGSVVTLVHLAREGELPMTPWGFRSMSGPFEELGPDAFIALGWALVGVSVLEVVAGAWLWQSRLRGARLALATTPLAIGLGAGFALPFLLIGAPLSAVLVLAGRRSLR